MADCPAGKVVVGGGFSLAAGLEVGYSAPFDSDSWGVAVNNPTTQSNGLRVRAVCVSSSV
jgi:hypothetical protein